MKRSLVAIALFGCAPAPQAPLVLAPLPESALGIDRATASREVGQIEDLADRMCACSSDACFDGVDRDMVAAFQAIPESDPLSDAERWPTDLDAIGDGAMRRMFGCAFEHRRIPRALEQIELIQLDRLSATACACTDEACATRARKKLDKIAHPELEGDKETRAAVLAAAGKVTACIADVEGEQALLELKAMRKDACACTDAACGDEVVGRFHAWMKEQAHAEAMPETYGELREVAGELGRCLARLGIRVEADDP